MEYQDSNERSALVPTNSSSSETKHFKTAFRALVGICGLTAGVCLVISNTAASDDTSAASPWWGLERITLNTGLFGSSFHTSSSSSSSSSSSCGEFYNIVFADIHDADKKMVSLEGDHLTIESVSDDEDWTIRSIVDSATCTAMVEFNVPGKPSPPPVPLLATLWNMEALSSSAADHNSKLTIEFTDPSETIAPSKSDPLNHWVQLN